MDSDLTFQKEVKDYFISNKRLGKESNQAEIFIAKHKTNHEQVACKVFDIKEDGRQKSEIQQKIIQTKREVSIHMKLIHQNIVRAIDFAQTKNSIYFFLELCDCTLRERMKSSNFNEKIAFFKQLVEAMIYLKQVPKQDLFFGNEKLEDLIAVYHRDLKPDNIFIKDNILKLGDFGCSKQFSEQLNTVQGSFAYMSYELLSAGQSRIAYDQEKNDVWAGGVILYEMLYGHLPFYQNQPLQPQKAIEERQLDHISKLPQFPDVPNDYKQLIINMLILNPKERFTWNQVRSCLQKDQLDESIIISASKQIVNAQNVLTNVEMKKKKLQQQHELEIMKFEFKIRLLKEISQNYKNISFWHLKAILTLMMYLFESIKLVILFNDNKKLYSRFLSTILKNVGINETDSSNFVLENEGLVNEKFQQILIEIENLKSLEFDPKESLYYQLKIEMNAVFNMIQIQNQLNIQLLLLKYPMERFYRQQNKAILILLAKLGWLFKNEVYINSIDYKNMPILEAELNKFNEEQLKKKIQILWELQQ